MATDNKELFGRQPVITVKPVTADMCTLTWSGEQGQTGKERVLSGATNVTISYQQQVIRRRTLASEGNRPIAVIYPTQPIGTMQIQRLFASMVEVGSGKVIKKTEGTHALFTYPGWNICNGTAQIVVGFNGSSAYADCVSSNPGYKINGATVTGYSISLEAENLTVVDNVTVEFLQLSPADSASSTPSPGVSAASAAAGGGI